MCKLHHCILLDYCSALRCEISGVVMVSVVDCHVFYICRYFCLDSKASVWIIVWIGEMLLLQLYCFVKAKSISSEFLSMLSKLVYAVWPLLQWCQAFYGIYCTIAWLLQCLMFQRT